MLSFKFRTVCTNVRRFPQWSSVFKEVTGQSTTTATQTLRRYRITLNVATSHPLNHQAREVEVNMMNTLLQYMQLEILPGKEDSILH